MKRFSVAFLVVLLAGVPAACDSASERAQEHLASGLELLEEGDPVKAALEFRNAIRLDETLARPHFELGKITQQQGNVGAAVARYRRALELDETLVGAHVRYGEILLAAGEVEEALSTSVTAFQLAPEDLRVLVLKASTHLQLGNVETARETAESALELHPGAPGPQLVLASLARRGGDAERALSIADAGLADTPGHLGLGLLRLELLVALERREEVAPALRALIERNPDEIALRQALVRWSISQRDFETAEAALRGIADRRPEDVEAALDVVRFLAATSGRDAAAQELSDRVASAPDTEAAYPFHRALAEFEIARGDVDAAVTRLRALVAEAGDRPIAQTARADLARLLLARDGTGSAEVAELVDAVLEADGQHADALIVRARVAIADDRPDSAITDLRSALDTRPDNAEALRLLSLAHQRAGNTDLAVERLSAAVEASDHDPQTVVAYARLLDRQGRRSAAEQAIEAGLERHPRDDDLLNALATVRLRSQDWKGAREVAEVLGEIDPDPTRAERIKAASLFGEQRFDESIETLKGSLDVTDPEAGQGLSGLVASYVRAGRNDEARSFLNGLVAENPDNAEAQVQLARLDASEGDLVAAERRYRRAVEAQPETARYYSALSRFLSRTGRREEAEEVVRAGLEEADDAGLRFSLALLLEARGDLEGAISQYEAIYAERPDSDVVANNLASLIADTDPTEAEIERAARIAQRLRDSEVPHFRDTYGWLAFLRGDHSEALVAIEQAAGALPDNAVVHYHLGAVLAEIGETDRAREALQRAVELGQGRSLPQVERAREILSGLDTQ